jgi:hypothetical protein
MTRSALDLTHGNQASRSHFEDSPAGSRNTQRMSRP